MKIEINLVFCALVVLTGSSQTIGQNSPLPPALTTVALPRQAGTSASPVLPVDAGDDVTQRTSTKTPTVTTADGIAQSETVTDAVHRNKLVTTTSGVTTSQRTAVPSVMTVNPGQPSASLSAAPDSPSSIPTLQHYTPLGHISTPDGSTHPAGDPHTTSTPHSAPSSRDTTPAQPSTQPWSESLTPAPTQPPTTSRPQTSAPAYAPAGPTHSEVPSELNVGDEDFKGPHHHPSSPLDPLLAGLVSVFIVTTAIISVVLFLKFRQRTNHPEFHRLQDLPMDDLMEDTPLSRYTY